jgi:FKBP-type peptidyl-prolyl cis-trans isomerase
MKKLLLSFSCLFFLVSCNQDTNIQNNLLESEKFLVTNLLNPGVVELESGLQYLVLDSVNSEEAHPKLTDTITADFHGTLINGKVFWSSVEMGEPLTIQLSKLIPGCQKVISYMREGDRWRVFIHPDLAYGEEGRPTIPPNSALIFDIELFSFRSDI